MSDNLFPKMVNDLLALSHVPRWVIVRTSRPQSVADHSYRVTIIAWELYRRLFDPPHPPPVSSIDPPPVVEVLIWALIHDAGESHTGDVPGHVKFPIKDGMMEIERDRCPWLAYFSISEATMALVKVADLMEAQSFIWMNRQGSHADSVWRYTDQRLREVIAQKAGVLGCSELTLYGQVREMLNHIESEIGRL